MDQKHLLSPSEVASLLGIQRRSLYKKSKRGEIPGRVKIGAKLLRFDPVEIERWLRECAHEPVKESER